MSASPDADPIDLSLEAPAQPAPPFDPRLGVWLCIQYAQLSHDLERAEERIAALESRVPAPEV